MIHNYYPLILDKIKNAEHLWVVYSDNTGYPYMIDGDLFVLYDYANHAELEKKLNTAGYQVALESVTPTDFRNEVAHMYRNGYEKSALQTERANRLLLPRKIYTALRISSMKNI